MTQFDNIIEQVLIELKSEDVANAAGVDPLVWSESRVFYGNKGLIKGANRGRCPFIHFHRNVHAFDWQAEPFHQGIATYELHVDCYTIKSDDYESEDAAYSVLETAIKKIRSNGILVSGEHQIIESESLPWGLVTKLVFTIQLSYEPNIKLQQFRTVVDGTIRTTTDAQNRTVV